MTGPVSRRRLLRSLPAAGALALAGCNESAEDAQTPSAGPTEVRVTSTDDEATPTGGGTTPSDGATTSTDEPPDEEPTPTDAGGAAVSVRDLSVEPSTVAQGESVTVRVGLRNDGSESTVHPLWLTLDGEVLRRKRIAVEPGASAEASFRVRYDRTGTRQFAAGSATGSVTVEPRPTGFVEVDGTSFVLDGEPFVLAGVNNAYLYHKTPKTAEEVIRDAAAMGQNTIRLLLNGGGTASGYCRDFACDRSTYGFQPEPGTFDEATFRRMDEVVATAKRHGVRLVVSLVTIRPGGMAAYVDWVDSAETLDDFFENEECRRLYREYLEAFLTRTNAVTGVEYREDPTILMWELANEPELQSSGRVFGPPLQSWIAEMAAHAKEIDPNHLVSVGMIGFTSEGNRADYAACFEPDAVDAVSTHLYYDADGVDDWIERHATLAHDLGKPLYVGEFGWDATRTDPDYESQLAARDDGFQRWYDQCVDRDVGGALAWHLIGHLDEGATYPDHDGFGFYYPEDATTVDVIESYADRVATGGGAD